MLSGLFVLLLLCLAAPAQRLGKSMHGDAKAGKAVYEAGCIACHGADGKGTDHRVTVFTWPDTWPDFTQCDQTTPEPDSNWEAVIRHGGKDRAFSQIMPSFGDYLKDQQIADVIAYMRTFCDNKHHFPLGAMNLPRALITEKAFPENELVQSTAVNTHGPASWTTDVIHEETFGGNNQLEVDVPVNYAKLDNNWTSGVGDITVGMKRVLANSSRTGTIFALQGSILLPTGDSNRGFGTGVTAFEPFAAFDQLLGNRSFVQLQLGGDLPIHTSISPDTIFFRSAFGSSIARDYGLGKLFTPMVELVANRDMTDGAKTDWDVVPQMQMTISRRQHVKGSVGFREPFTDTAGRSPQVVFYLLWDRADGKLWEGWR